MRKFNYELENELALINKEVGKAKAMIEDIQEDYAFTDTDTWKPVIAFDALCRIEDIVSSLNAKNEAGDFAKDAGSVTYDAEVVVNSQVNA